MSSLPREAKQFIVDMLFEQKEWALEEIYTTQQAEEITGPLNRCKVFGKADAMIVQLRFVRKK